MNLDAPFPTGCWIPRRNQPNLWVVYKYERLQSLCYKCGKIGHDQMSCKNQLARAIVDPNRPKYGLEICVSAPRSIGFMGRDQSSQEQQNPPNSIEEESPYEEELNKHYRNIALSLQAKPLQSANDIRDNHMLPDLNYAAIPAKVQSLNDSPLFHGGGCF